MQDNYLVNLQNENQELAETCAKMQQIMQQQQDDKSKDTKLKSKLKKITANKNKLSKNLKSKERELRQLKVDLNTAKQLSKGDTSVVKTMQEQISQLKKDLKSQDKILNNLRQDNQNKDNIIQSLTEQIRKMEENPSQPARVESNNYSQNVYENTAYQQSKNEERKSEDAESDHQDDDDDDDYKDDSYEDPQESNIVEDTQPHGEVDNKDEEVKGETKNIISEIEVDPLFEKVQLMLQRKGIEYNKMGEMLPKPVTIISLEHKLKAMGLKDPEERLAISRYIVEPRDERKVEFNENREISNLNAENILKSKIDAYTVFKNDEEEYQKRVRQQIGRYTSTLKDALEWEDLDGTGYMPANALKGCFHAMDINLDSDLIEYLIYLSGVLEKIGSSNHLMLEYSKIVEIAEKQDSEDSPKPQKDDRKSTDLLGDDYSDGYGDDFEDDKNDQTGASQDVDGSKDQELKKLIATDDKDPDVETEKSKDQHDSQDEDAEIDDEQMITIAENCLIRIAEELLSKDMTVRQLFEGEILAEEIEGQKIELLFPTSFLDGIQKLGITDFSDLENAWLMNVLAKPQLENTILLDELIDIMENLGIPDGEGGQVQQDLGAQESVEPDQEASKPTESGKQKKKGVDLNGLSDDSKNLLLNFVIFLESESMTAANFFQEVKYEQMIKTKKNKQSSVDIVPADDFFRLMEENYEIVSDVNLTEEVKKELQEILWLDANYKELLFMKKIDKALNEIKNIS